MTTVDDVLVTNDDPMEGPAQISAVAQLVGQGVHYRSGTAAQRAAVPTGEKLDGLIWQDTDGTKGSYRWDGSWLPNGPFKTAAVARQFSATNHFDNAVATTDFPITADKTATTITFTKVFAATKLIIQINASGQLTDGGSQAGLIVMRLNTTDYDAARYQFATGPARGLIVGVYPISGLAAGDYTIYPRFRAATASKFDFYTDDRISYSVTESL